MTVTSGPDILRNNVQWNYDFSNNKCYSGSGTTVNDLMGNGYTGTLTLGPTFSSNALVFDNSDDYVLMPNAPQRTNQSFSFFAWVYLNSTPGAGITNGIWGHYGVSSVNCHFETYTSYTRIRLGDVNNSGLPVFPAGSWTYAGFTTTGSTHNYYINGSLVATWSGTTGAVLGNPGTPSQMIGRSDALRTWNGKIATAFLSLSTLSDAEVSKNFNAYRSRFGI